MNDSAPPHLSSILFHVMPRFGAASEKFGGKLSPWKFVRVTYIIPLPDGVFGGREGIECSQEDRPVKGQPLRSYLPEGVDAPSIGRPSGRVLGDSIEQALGLGRHIAMGDGRENRLPRRVKLNPKPDLGGPEDIGHPDWEAEWVKFGHPKFLSTHADFLLIHTEVPEVADDGSLPFYEPL